MSTKTISITEEAYERLRTRKAGKESFTDVINRLTGRTSLLGFFGVLSDKSANGIERAMKESRKKSLKRADLISGHFNDS